MADDDEVKSSACYANPEPPPEIQRIQQDDLIGNTMFSKHWVFGVLLKLIEKVDHDEPSVDEENKENGLGSSPAEPVVKELDGAFEKDLCDLWDMTVEKDVCNLLDEFNSLKIFEGYMIKYDLVYPRAVEILIGIVVNMVSLSSPIANKLLKNSELMIYLVQTKLNQMNDVPVLIQVIRLLTIILTTGYSNDDDDAPDGQVSLAKYFIETYFKTRNDETTANSTLANRVNENFSFVIDNFNFIFNSSLNGELIDCTCLFIASLMDADEQILDAFAGNAKFLEAICNAAHTRLRLDRSDKSFTGAQFTTSKRQESETKLSSRNPNQPRTPFQAQNYVSQVSEDDISSLDHLFNKFFMCLQSMSTCELGVMALSDKAPLVIDLLNIYLERCLANFNDWEVSSSNSLKSSICSESLQNFICLISLLSCLFSNMSQVHKPKNGDQLAATSQSSDEGFDINNKAHLNFSLKLFTLCKYYINLIGEAEKAAERASENGEDESAEASFFQMENFEEMVKSNMQEFLNCFIEFNGHLISETKNKSLFTLLNDCTNLLSNLS